MMRALFVICALAAVLASQAAPILYGSVTELIDFEQQTALFVVQVDMSTGATQNVTEVVVFNGGSATIDGISALNPKTGDYWFTDDSGNPVQLYSVNVNTKSLLPPLEVGCLAIEKLNADVLHNNLYIACPAQNGNFIAKVNSFGTVSVVYTIPKNLYFNSAALNAAAGLYYMIALTNSNFSNPQLKIFSVNVTSGDLVHTSGLLSCPGLVTYAAYSAKANIIYALMETYQGNNLVYSFNQIDPQLGTCKSVTAKLNNGIATAATFSETLQKFFVAVAVNGGNLIFPINVKSGVVGQPISTPYILETIEVSA